MNKAKIGNVLLVVGLVMLVYLNMLILLPKVMDITLIPWAAWTIPGLTGIAWAIWFITRKPITE